MPSKSCHAFFLISLSMMLSMCGIEEGYLVIRKSKKILLTGGKGGHGDQESESWKDVLEACEASIALHSEVTLSYN